MEELLEAVTNAANVSKITYFNETMTWVIEYHNNLKPDVLSSSNLIDFLNNA